MTKEEIVTALLDDVEMPYLQDWQARDIVDFVLKKYTEGLPTIKGWVARDYDSEVFFHCNKPQKFHEEGIEYWANGGYRFMVPQSMQSAFWELCTTDEPIEVELTIHRV